MKHVAFNITPKANDQVCNETADTTTQETWHVKSKMNTMLITFFDTMCIIHFEFIPQGQTVKRAYYVEILKQLREGVRGKIPGPRTELSTITML
jgi:hypothetical protein